MSCRYTKNPFNVAFGNALRGQRIAHGYKRAQDFAEAVSSTCGVRITLDMMRRIESGRQSPTVEQYAAMCLTLDGKIIEPMLHYAACAHEGELGERYRLIADFDKIATEQTSR